MSLEIRVSLYWALDRLRNSYDGFDGGAVASLVLMDTVDRLTVDAIPKRVMAAAFLGVTCIGEARRVFLPSPENEVDLSSIVIKPIAETDQEF